MNEVIYNPLEEYENKFKNLHFEKTTAFFDELVKKSGVNVEENRKTIKSYNENKENTKKIKRKLNWLRFLRVLMCISLLLIPVVILKTTPKIKELREHIENSDKEAEKLFKLAEKQMKPLNDLFTDKDAINLTQDSIPLLSFSDYFSVNQETDMKINYDFKEKSDTEQSTLEVLAGNYNENPFLFENKLIHKMGTETYHGYKTIHWTETYRDSEGRLRTRTKSETLHATVTKPKPFYSTQVVLNYCAQGAPDLKFTRDASNLHEKSEKQIERFVKKGEKRLNKKNEKAISENSDFMSMSNSEFEVLFDALDRTDEVQFRTLFTPLAQTNMVDLILSKTGYGDDFNFIKAKRTNRIISNHSQNRAIALPARGYKSNSFDTVREQFISQNVDFFKAVYFDFAPILAIPIYQERPVHSLKPIPDLSQLYSLKECEVLANAVDTSYIVHPKTKTRAILKSTFVATHGSVDETHITAYSYDIEPRYEYVSVHGGDGRWHDVKVDWDEYLPLVAENNFYVSSAADAKDKNVIARRNSLCIFN